MKTVLITGASRGLGKSMAIHLAKKGYNILFTYKNSLNESQKLKSEIETLGQKAFYLQLDTSKVDGFDKFVEDFSLLLENELNSTKIDLMINNAGIGISEAFEDTTIEQFDKLVDIHIKGPYFLTQKILPYINDGGMILNISSGLARFCLQGYSAYGMMKGAIEVFSRYLAVELGKRNIRVNTIAPGAIETDFDGGRVRDNENVNDIVASQIALNRVGKPDDIGEAVANIAQCYWINGQRIEVSGGMRL